MEARGVLVGSDGPFLNGRLSTRALIRHFVVQSAVKG